MGGTTNTYNKIFVSVQFGVIWIQVRIAKDDFTNPIDVG